jgi:hypothetical protein
MTQSQSDEQGATPRNERRNRPEPIGRNTGLGAAAFVRAGFHDATLILHWAEIVGPDIARFAVPIKFSESPSGGVLTLKAEPAASTFLQHETRRLCDRINAYLGRAAVSRLRFAAGSVAAREPPRERPQPPKPVSNGDPARSFSGPDRLKAALLGLAQSRLRPARD